MENLKIQNKKGVLGGFSAKDFIIALVLFFGFMMLVFVGAIDFANNYGQTIIDSDLQARYNKLTNITILTNETYMAVSSGEGLNLAGGVSGFNFILKSTFQVFLLIFESIGISTVMFINVFYDLQVPTGVASIIGVVILTIIIIVITLKIVSSTLFKAEI